MYLCVLGGGCSCYLDVLLIEEVIEDYEQLWKSELNRLH